MQVHQHSLTDTSVGYYIFTDTSAYTDNYITSLSNISISPEHGLLTTDNVQDIFYLGLTPGTTYTITYTGTLTRLPEDGGGIAYTDVNIITFKTTGGGNDAICFLSDAPVLTPHGYRPICEFRVGDLVMTADGREVAVKRVFRREYGSSAAANPYVIPKGSFGATRPIAISPNHEVMTPNGMVKARDLGLKRMKMADNFTYYNLELEDWVRDNLVVAGVICESLAPAARITMTKSEFARFVAARYGPSAAARLRLQSVCFEEADGCVSMPSLM